MSKGNRIRGGGRRQRTGHEVPQSTTPDREVMTPHGHCLGVEIEHGDGHVECSNGELCPGGEHHVGITVSCGLARGSGKYEVRHECSECAA